MGNIEEDPEDENEARNEAERKNQNDG